MLGRGEPPPPPYRERYRLRGHVRNILERSLRRITIRLNTICVSASFVALIGEPEEVKRKVVIRDFKT